MHSNQVPQTSLNAIMTGANVLVFGGSSGIGLAVARSVIASGGAVTIVGRDGERLTRATAALGPQARSAQADVADPEQVMRVVDRLEHIDHVLCAAGTYGSEPVLEVSTATVQRRVDERIGGALNIVRATAPRLQKGGSITLVSGTLASRPVPGTALLSALIAAIESLARGLALELAPIRVNAVAPGWTDTPLVRNNLATNYEAVVDAVASRLPVQRIGRPDEIAQAVLLLMSNGFITGEVLHVDGGGRWV